MDYVYGIINQRVKKNQYTGGSTDTATVHIDNATNIITVDAQEQKEQVNADWNAIEGVAEILNKPSIKGLDNGSVLVNDVLRNNASGSLSTAVGSRTSARGDYSFAEGYITVASGLGAHAEGAASLDFGKLVIASGTASHAEGMNTEASGIASHAEGIDTEASGEYAHTDGQYTVARGRNSSASGLYTIANRASQKVFGEYNISDTASGSFTTRGTYVEIVGNGTAINSRSNARTLDWNGNEVIAGKLTVGTNPTNDMDVATKQYVDNNSSNLQYVKDYINGSGNLTGGVIEGMVVDETGENITLNSASGKYSHAEGGGYEYNENSAEYVSYSTTASGLASHAEGWSTTASGNFSHAEGISNTASGVATHAEGSYTTASGDMSHAEGYHTIVSGDISHAEGSYTTASGDMSHAEGQFTTASGDMSHAEGYHTVASGDMSHAEGTVTIASKQSAHAEGDNTTASGDISHAEGGHTTASGTGSHAEGSYTTASGDFSHVEGNGTKATRFAHHVFGTYNIEDSFGSVSDQKGQYVEIVGNGVSNNNRSNARTLDWNGNEILAGKLTVGAGPTNNMDVATKQYTDTKATAAENAAKAYTDTQSLKWTVDFDDSTTLQATIQNDVEHNVASAPYAHAEGTETTASGQRAHAEGKGTQATANGAHAEGYYTVAAGAASHAEGARTEASGTNGSHAEGNVTVASGESSHAEGEGTIASKISQHVVGRYNVEDPAIGNVGTYVEIVGNGHDNVARSNARTLDWSGNEILAGKLTLGAGPVNNMDAVTKAYADGKAAYIVTATAVPSAQGITWTSDKTFAEIKAQIDNGNFNIIVQANVPAVTKYIFNLVSYSNTTIIFCYTPNPCDEQWLFFKSDGTITEVYDTVPRIPDTNLLTEGTYNLHATVQIAENVGNSYATLSWVKDTEITGTLTAGTTTLTLTDSAITTSSIVEIYTDIYGVAPMSVTTTAGHITMVFIPQMTDLKVKVIIKE